MTISHERNCDNCTHYCWYYDWCDKFEIKVDGREVHDCFSELKTRSSEIADKDGQTKYI